MDCPDCGSSYVAVDLTPPHNPTDSLSTVVRRLSEGESAGEMQWCSVCGWTETRRVRLEEIEVERGDSEVKEKMRIRQEITDTISELESISSLEDALSEVTRVCQQNQHGAEDED